MFLGNKSLCMYLDESTPLRNEMKNIPSKNVEKLYNIQYIKENAIGDAVIQAKMDKDGWREREFTASRMLYEKQSPDGDSTLLLSCNGSWESEQWQYSHLDFGTDETIENSPVDEKTTWADWDASGCLITVKDGIVTCHDAVYDYDVFAEVNCNQFQKPGSSD